MTRLTRKEDEYPCRIKDCYAEEWMNEIYGNYPLGIIVCDTCPFINLINHLGSLEDKIELEEDDLK